MTMFNVMAGGRQQVLVDEQQLQQLQGEVGRRGAELERLRAAMETLTAVNAPAKFMAAAMALCNELASRWKAERVAIGMLKGRYVRVQSISHTEKITRHMQLVQDIEGAMEECLDQDVEVFFPPPKDASFVYRSTERFARRDGQTAVCNFPLRRDGKVVAVLTVERASERPLQLDEIETLRLTSDLFTARLYDLYEHDRFIGVKAAKATKKGLGWVVGTKHTWAKVIALAVIGLVCFAVFVNGDHRVEAPFELEASEMQHVSAPFDGYLKTVSATIGDMVITEKTAARFSDLEKISPVLPVIGFKHPPTILATLDTVQQRGHLISAQAEYAMHSQQENIAREQGKEGEVQAAHDEALESEAQVKLYEAQIEQATIKAPVDGVIFAGDLRTKIDAPLKAGDELFLIGERKKLRAKLSVSEEQIADVQVGQHGELAVSSDPGNRIGFRVERVDPIAVVSAQKNVFKVRVQLDSAGMKRWMMPGMEGIAKVHVGQARYVWIWTHRLVDWVRMKLWL